MTSNPEKDPQGQNFSPANQCKQDFCALESDLHHKVLTVSLGAVGLQLTQTTEEWNNFARTFLNSLLLS